MNAQANQIDWVASVPASHRRDPATSHVAERRITESGTRKTHAELVLAAVKAHPGITAPELMVVTRLGEYQVRRRLSDLKAIGKVDRQHERDGNSCWWAP